jgi:hypothetical protein
MSTQIALIITIAAFIAQTIYGVLIILKYQKRLIEKDKFIAAQKKNAEVMLAELNRWEVYNIGLLGDLAYLVDGNDQVKRAEIKRKWQRNFQEKRKMQLQKQGQDLPSDN